MAGTVFTISVSVIFFVLSLCQFKEKGHPLNNAYLFASENEKKTMDMSPHFRQSAIVFLMLGLLFMFLALDLILDMAIMSWLAIAVGVITVVYAVCSSVKIRK